MSVVDEAMQDLVLTAVRATVALDRMDWESLLDAARHLQEHGIQLAGIASRRLVKLELTKDLPPEPAKVVTDDLEDEAEFQRRGTEET